MESKKMLAILVVALGLMVCSASVSEAQPIGTAFTYQGWLMDDKKPADKEYDFQFRLYDANVGGTQQGSTIDVNDLEVTDGYFTVRLDFGNEFDGNERWLETTVAQSDGSDPCTLDPRLEVSLSPYAIYAKTAGAVPEAIAGAIVPTGGIIMWSGSIGNIPTGWALCDGTNGTPDLRNKFIIAAGGAYSVGNQGGSVSHNHGATTGSHTLTISEMPSHKHLDGFISNTYHIGIEGSSTTGVTSGVHECSSANNPSEGSDEHRFYDSPVGSGGGHTHSISTEDHIPPFYALCFIMKLP